MLVCSAIVLNLGAFGLLFRPYHENDKLPLICVQGRWVRLRRKERQNKYSDLFGFQNFLWFSSVPLCSVSFSMFVS